MGTRMAPSYVNLFMGKLEREAHKNAPFKPYVWWRFIDDIFMVWTGEDNLKTFTHYLNSIHPTIKFTHEHSNSLHQTLPFLDVQVHLNNKQIQTDLHTKPTNTNTFSTLPAILLTQNAPFRSALPYAYVASAPLTFSLINATRNLSTFYNHGDTVAAFSKKKSTAYATSHVKKLLNHDHRTTTQTERLLLLRILQLFPTFPLLYVRM